MNPTPYKSAGKTLTQTCY